MLEHGAHRAVVVELGAALASYTVGGVDVLDGFAPSEGSHRYQGHVLAPWPNRIAGGRYVVGGAVQQLALTEPATGGAIHGLANWYRWELVEAEPDRVSLGLDLHPQPGYPFSLRLGATYRLGSAGLEVELSGENHGPDPAPFGLGAHPYLRLGAGTGARPASSAASEAPPDRPAATGPGASEVRPDHPAGSGAAEERAQALVDGYELRLDAGVYLESDERSIPVARHAVAGTPFDLSTGAPLGDRVLDTAFGALARDADGRVRAVLRDPGSGRAVTVWGDEACAWWMVFTGDTLPEPKRRRSVAIEPMTCPPDAFNSGEDLWILRPGEGARLRFGVEPAGFPTAEPEPS